MKKWKHGSMAFLILCLSLLLPSAAALGASAGNKLDGPELLAEAAVMMDADTGEILYSKDMDETEYPGGLTKIMTTLLLAENCNLEEKVSFSEILYNVEEGGLRLGLQPGEEITLYDAACAIMLGSSNDVSNGVAEYMAGSSEAFAEMMNARAAQLGCTNTHFSNPHGLSSSDNYTCARDLALIARAAYENETLRQICSLKEYTIPATNLNDGVRQLQNYHQMLQEGSGYYQDWCMGGKESYTSQSLNSVMTFGSRDGKNLISVVMGVYDSGEAYAETARLFSYGFGDDTAGEELTETESETERATEKITESPAPATEEQIPAAEESSESRTPESGETGEGLQDDTRLGGAPGTLTAYLDEGKRFLSAYAEEHFTVVFACGCVFLLLLFVLIVLLLRRCITDSRIRRKRKKAEKIWKEKESLVEQMTVEELEEELRRRGESGEDAGGQTCGGISGKNGRTDDRTRK